MAIQGLGAAAMQLEEAGETAGGGRASRGERASERAPRLLAGTAAWSQVAREAGELLGVRGPGGPGEVARRGQARRQPQVASAKSFPALLAGWRGRISERVGCPVCRHPPVPSHRLTLAIPEGTEKPGILHPATRPQGLVVLPTRGAPSQAPPVTVKPKGCRNGRARTVARRLRKVPGGGPVAVAGARTGHAGSVPECARWMRARLAGGARGSGCFARESSGARCAALLFGLLV